MRKERKKIGEEVDNLDNYQQTKFKKSIYLQTAKPP